MYFWANIVIFLVFATQQIILPPVQLLFNNELFHQSGFYLKNIVLLFRLLFQQRYLHLSPGEKVQGWKCPRPVFLKDIGYATVTTRAR